MATASVTARRIGYWVTTTLVVVLFAIPGVALLVRTPHFVSEMAHLGYPPYFLTILGPWKILGAAAIAAPRFARVKEWAYAGMIFDATSAAASRAAVGDGAAATIGALLIAGLVVLSWALRPAERALQVTRMTTI